MQSCSRKLCNSTNAERKTKTGQQLQLPVDKLLQLPLLPPFNQWLPFCLLSASCGHLQRKKRTRKRKKVLSIIRLRRRQRNRGYHYCHNRHWHIFPIWSSPCLLSACFALFLTIKRRLPFPSFFNRNFYLNYYFSIHSSAALCDRQRPPLHSLLVNVLI